jgi:ribonuclease D
MQKATIIDRDDKLHNLVEELQQKKHIAIDTEANSLFAYYEKVCLIQLSARNGNRQINDYIIDPFAINDMSPLGAVLADPSTEVILHGAEYDIMLLKRDFDFTFSHIFDTHLAARTLGIRKVGLSSLLDKYFDIKIDKRFQQSNWGKRPLSSEQLRYAQYDSHYLLDLRDMLYDKIVEAQLLEELQETHDLLADLPPIEKTFDEEGFWRIKAAKSFNNTQLAILKELYLWREQTAETLNRPPFKVLQNSTLARLAQEQPTSLNQLRDFKGVSKTIVKRFGTDLLGTIERGKTTTPPRPKRQSQIPTTILDRYDTLHSWRKQKAAERGVESDIIISKQVLWALAHNPPEDFEDLKAVEELGDYRRHKYGKELLQIFDSSR